MDALTILGVVLGFAALLGGNFLEGGNIDSLLNPAAALIVIGGTLGAAVLQTPMATLKRALHMFRWVLLPPPLQVSEGVGKIIDWSNTARKEGLLGLEHAANTEDDMFARKALQLLVDGSEPEVIRNVMEVDLVVREQREHQGADFFASMGGYAPTIGILGAVMGLIHVMSNLAEPSKLGAGIAVAFVATIYGVGLANLLLLPIASKLKGCVVQRSQFREMVIEGIIAIAEGENPRAIELKLHGYLE